MEFFRCVKLDTLFRTGRSLIYVRAQQRIIVVNVREGIYQCARERRAAVESCFPPD